MYTENLYKIIEKEFGVTGLELRGRARSISCKQGRVFFIVAARNLLNWTWRRIGEEFLRDRSTGEFLYSRHQNEEWVKFLLSKHKNDILKLKSDEKVSYPQH